MPKSDTAARTWETLRLKDQIRPGTRVLFVGINPGVRSAQTGHHFAGPSNRFWKLLWDAALVPEPITHTDDHRLPEFGYGITNLIARPSPGIDTLLPSEYVAGWKVLDRKIRKHRPAVVALVGVTLWRAILPLLKVDDDHRARLKRSPTPGAQPVTLHGAAVHVLPNPSGRNAHFSYAACLAAFRELKMVDGINHLPGRHACTPGASCPVRSTYST